MWSCFSQSHVRRCKENGVFSIGVVHGGTAVEPPLRRQQVLHVVLLYSIWVVHGGTAVEPPSRRQQVLHVVLL